MICASVGGHQTKTRTRLVLAVSTTGVLVYLVSQGVPSPLGRDLSNREMWCVLILYLFTQLSVFMLFHRKDISCSLYSLYSTHPSINKQEQEAQRPQSRLTACQLSAFTFYQMFLTFEHTGASLLTLGPVERSIESVVSLWAPYIIHTSHDVSDVSTLETLVQYNIDLQTSSILTSN